MEARLLTPENRNSRPSRPDKERLVGGLLQHSSRESNLEERPAPNPASVPSPPPVVVGLLHPEKRDERAPLLSDAQWLSLSRALNIEEVQAMIIVGDAPFVSDSILDARAKARHPSNVRVERKDEPV